MVTHMHIENFKCFKDFDVDLGPFNVLIGPNDSGKTALLQTIILMGQMGPGPALQQTPNQVSASTGVPLGLDVIWQNDETARVCIKVRGSENSDLPKGYGLVAIWSWGKDFLSGLSENYFGKFPMRFLNFWSSHNISYAHLLLLIPAAFGASRLTYYCGYCFLVYKASKNF
ncbi:MAG: AAA family ATPase [Nanoarchaeota archaeon]